MIFLYLIFSRIQTIIFRYYISKIYFLMFKINRFKKIIKEFETAF